MQMFWENFILGKNDKKQSRITWKWGQENFVKNSDQIWLKLVLDKSINDVVTFYQNYISCEILVQKRCAEMFSSNQTAVLFDHEYLWKELINIVRVFPWNDSPKKGNT